MPLPSRNEGTAGSCSLIARESGSGIIVSGSDRRRGSVPAASVFQSRFATFHDVRAAVTPDLFPARHLYQPAKNLCRGDCQTALEARRCRTPSLRSRRHGARVHRILEASRCVLSGFDRDQNILDNHSSPASRIAISFGAIRLQKGARRPHLQGDSRYRQSAASNLPAPRSMARSRTSSKVAKLARSVLRHIRFVAKPLAERILAPIDAINQQPAVHPWSDKLANAACYDPNFGNPVPIVRLRPCRGRDGAKLLPSRDPPDLPTGPRGKMSLLKSRYAVRRGERHSTMNCELRCRVCSQRSPVSEICS